MAWTTTSFASSSAPHRCEAHHTHPWAPRSGRHTALKARNHALRQRPPALAHLNVLGLLARPVGASPFFRFVLRRSACSLPRLVGAAAASYCMQRAGFGAVFAPARALGHPTSTTRRHTLPDPYHLYLTSLPLAMLFLVWQQRAWAQHPGQGQPPAHSRCGGLLPYSPSPPSTHTHAHRLLWTQMAFMVCFAARRSCPRPRHRPATSFRPRGYALPLCAAP